MARNGRGGFGGAGRDGVDNQFDGRPGNTSDSPSYGRIYGSEHELSNLPESANYREVQRLQMAADEHARQSRTAVRHARSDVHFFPSVGKFIVPKQNTWAAHAEMVKDPNYALAFNPGKFPYFDQIVAEEFGNKALTDPNHPDYHKYEGLRTNLAVLRNDIIGMKLDDGSFDPGDEKFIPIFVGTAAAIGQALANDHWLKRPFTQSLSLDVANVEGVGAREIYKHLLDIQTKRGSARHLLSKIAFLNIPDHTWDLRPLEETPFSTENLAAPPPETKICLTSDELAKRCNDQDMPLQERIAVFGENAMNNAVALKSLDTLAPPAREESIEEAYKILRWLRNLSFGDKDMEEWLDQGTPAEQVAKAEAIARLTEIYGAHLAVAEQRVPGIQHDAAVSDASGAAGVMAISLAELGLKDLPGDHPEVRRLAEFARELPPSWRLHEGQPVSRLLDAVEEGIERTSGYSLSDKPVVERLLEISAHIERTANHLRSIDTLAPPAREESIELAREILRRLKNMSFSDKPIEEMINHARPEDKAAFARKLSDMVDIYSNLLQEAVQANPDILADPRIQEANDAVGSFSYAVKLMAAKEMPNSVAAAQQISADVTQVPEEWKKLHDRTVNRLITSMEGGLEKAVEELGVEQQQAQDQDEELARQIVESSTQDHHHRRKRRRKRRGAGTTGGLTKSAKRRNARDLNGDGILDKLQGLNLRGDDLIAVKQLGGSLRNMSDQASTLAPVNVTIDDKIAPDDKTFSVRERDQRNPNSPNNPRR